MKSIVLFFVVSLLWVVANGQILYQDVVYLKNGSIIRGIIVEQTPNKSIKIETSDRSIFVFFMEDIERIVKEQFKTIDNSGTNQRNSKANWIIGIGAGKPYLKEKFRKIEETPIDKAIIYIYRPYKYSGSGVHFLVKANDIPVNDQYLFSSGYMVFLANPGMITFKGCYLGMCDELSVRVEAGKSYFIQGSLGMKPSFKLRDEAKALKKIRKCRYISNHQE